MRLKLLITGIFVLQHCILFAQNGVRIAATTGTADGSAMLDVVSTTKGFLVPRMNLTGPALTNPAPVTSPATGLLVYNLGGGGIAATGFYYWSGTQWVQLSAGALSGAGTTNYVAKWTSASAIGNSQMYDDGTNVGVGMGTSAISKLHSSGNLTVGSGTTPQAIGNVQITTGGASPISNRLTYGTDGTGWKFAIGKNQGGTITEQLTIQDNGRIGVSINSPAYTFELPNGGTFGWGDGTDGSYKSRTESRADAGLIASQSGFFQTSAPSPSPSWPVSSNGASSGFSGSNATGWWHLLDNRHSNPGNNYAMQFSGSFFDQNLYFRKTNNNASQPWSQVVTRNLNAVIFGCIGQDQTYTVPAGVTSLTIIMWGAGGGGGWRGGWSNGFSGGGGGFSTGTLAVTPGQVYTIVVGRGGSHGITNNSNASYGGGGRSCGGTDCQYCGQGGGRSAVRNLTNTADLITAGGGGGGGVNTGLGITSRNRGGAGGGATGQQGECTANAATGGGGGTQAAGGAGGTGAQRTGTAGVAYQGGQPGNTESYGGGGGGGFFGGGGGGYTNGNTMGGGGGGSGYIGGVTNGFTQAGNRDVPAGMNNPYYIGGVGVGGRNDGALAYPHHGGDGLVVIIPNY